MKKWLNIWLCLALGLSMGVARAEATGEATMPYTVYQIAEAALPERVTNPYRSGDALSARTPEKDAEFNAWWASMEAAQGGAIPDKAVYDRFVKATARVWLEGEAGQKTLYAPLDLWFSLRVFARLTGGSTQGQLLTLLGLETADALEAQAAALWRCVYWRDDLSTWLPSASLWLDRDVALTESSMAALAEACHASVFQGDRGDAAYSEALRAWLDRQTGNLLEEKTAGIALDPSDALSVCTTLYCRAPWMEPFLPESTTRGAFHAPRGDVETDYMRRRWLTSAYVGDGFASVLLELEGGGRLALILPDEGVTPAELLSGEAVFDYLAGPEEWRGRVEAMVNLAMPRLDCEATLSLREGLGALGVTELFGDGDFSPSVIAERPVRVSDIRQLVRLTADEAGMEAASITISGAFGALMPEREIDMTLDRPFLFALLGRQDAVLFMGAVNEP